MYHNIYSQNTYKIRGFVQNFILTWTLLFLKKKKKKADLSELKKSYILSPMYFTNQFYK